MCVCAHVHGHSIHGDRQIGPVIKIETAQEILVGLPLAAMLRDQKSRGRLERFGRAGENPLVDLAALEISLARRIRGPFAGPLRDDVDRGELFLRPCR